MSFEGSMSLAPGLVSVALRAGAGDSAAAGMTGVGSTGSTVATASQAGTGPADSTDTLAYAGCMRTDATANRPDPKTNSGLLIEEKEHWAGQGNEVFMEANKACEDLRGDGGVRISPENRESVAVALKIVAGVGLSGEPTLPEPVPGGSKGADIVIEGGIDPRSQQFKPTQKACQLPCNQFGAIP